jgi:DNA-binding NarL/FixJ family response regulator
VAGRHEVRVSPRQAPAGTSPTPAELAALQAYLDAGGVKAAAHRLGVTPSTVKSHLANVRSRVGARTTAEAVLMLSDVLVA